MKTGNVQYVDFRTNDGYKIPVVGRETIGMRYEHLTLDRLKAALDYDAVTGVFRWRERPYRNSKRKAGDVAGSKKVNQNGRNYRVISIDGRAYQASQLAFFYVHGRWARGQVGQRNGVHDDLRAENLIEMMTTSGKHDFTTQDGRARYQRDYWESNPGFRQELAFKRLYRITLADYNAMLAAQNGVCAICSKPETSVQGGKVRFLAVDHAHDETGSVRGLLCMNCNSCIGRMNDDPELLEKAAAYLRRHAAKKEAA